MSALTATTGGAARGPANRKACRRAYRRVNEGDLAEKLADDRRVARVLHRVLFLEKRYDARQVARGMGIAYATLAAYCEALIPFPRHRLRSLFAATQDAVLAAELLDLPGIRWTMAPLPAASTPRAVRSLALDAAESVAHMGADLSRAMEPDSEGGEAITESERRHVAAHIEESHRKIETIKQAVDRMGGDRGASAVRTPAAVGHTA